MGVRLTSTAFRVCLLWICCSTWMVFVSCSSPAEKTKELVAQLENTDPNKRREVALELAVIGQEAQSAVPALIVALYDTNWEVRNAAAHALKRIGTTKALLALEEAVPYYISALGHGNPEVRWYAAEGLGYFGECGKSALPALAQATKDTTKAVQNAAAFSFRKISAQAPSAIPD